MPSFDIFGSLVPENISYWHAWVQTLWSACGPTQSSWPALIAVGDPGPAPPEWPRLPGDMGQRGGIWSLLGISTDGGGALLNVPHRWGPAQRSVAKTEDPHVTFPRRAGLYILGFVSHKMTYSIVFFLSCEYKLFKGFLLL